MFRTKILFYYGLFCCLIFSDLKAQESVAHQWNEAQLSAIRKDLARPFVQARNLFHVSGAMYDAWAAYDSIAKPFLLGNTIGSYIVTFDGVPAPSNIDSARNEAISYAAYRVLYHRYFNSPGAATALPLFDTLMMNLGYDINYYGTDYTSGNPADLGNYIANAYIAFGFQDGANEQFNYGNTVYQPINAPLVVGLPGNSTMTAPNNWQPLALDVFIDQNGNVLPNNVQIFQGPEWGHVVPFALKPSDLSIKQRNGVDWFVYHDPGMPPVLSTDTVSTTSEEYQWNYALVSAWSGQLDTKDSVMWDISPGAIGNNQSYPTTLAGLHDFYDLENGGDKSPGHEINPVTGLPYEPQIVPRGDYTRVLAEYWADGPKSETPPGHWFTVLNYVSKHPLFKKKFRGQGEELSDLEWDIKTYFALGGAVHDAAITAWGIKGWYDGVRPISAIRYMAGLGQSSNPDLPSYHPDGLPLIPNYIELVQMGDTLAGIDNVNVGKVKVFAWKGATSLSDPLTQTAGVDWILAENWVAYQRPTFVTPPFAGYISGHSTYSRAAAEVMTMITGDAYFPGGMSEFDAPKNQYLVFEDGPSVDIKLTWATYRDASDQCSLSRIWGGIHPPFDDMPGRLIGAQVGIDAFNLAESYFYKDSDTDGAYSDIDCDDNNANVYPGAAELCDNIDNDCNTMIDDNIPYYNYYADYDGDTYGDSTSYINICQPLAPMAYVDNNLDCNDNDATVNPVAVELCDFIDNDCNILVDDNIPYYNYYADNDGDTYGDSLNNVSTCDVIVPQGFVNNTLDCNDADVTINPSAAEICDNLDNDCNTIIDDNIPYFAYYQDNDSDGFGNESITQAFCNTSAPSGFSDNGLDCDDASIAINPDAIEIDDNIDNNCDNVIDEGFSATQSVASNAIKIYPTIVTDIVHITAQNNETYLVRMTNASGKTLVTKRFNNSIDLNLEDKINGIYFIEVCNETATHCIIEKVVKM